MQKKMLRTVLLRIFRARQGFKCMTTVSH
uniref:Uncharacterized protein n=1 Tax=Arundo donax TaxID=35708 RepID=A0A0A9H8Y5_ARUDO